MSNKKRVLVVDNHAGIADALRDLFRLSGHEAHAVHSGIHAIDAVPVQRPDVIVLDLEMPHLDGFETIGVLKRLPAAHSSIFVAYTARHDRRTIARIKPAGFHFYVKKPAAFEKFERILASLKKNDR